MLEFNARVDIFVYLCVQDMSNTTDSFGDMDEDYVYRLRGDIRNSHMSGIKHKIAADINRVPWTELTQSWVRALSIISSLCASMGLQRAWMARQVNGRLPIVTSSIGILCSVSIAIAQPSADATVRRHLHQQTARQYFAIHTELQNRLDNLLRDIYEKREDQAKEQIGWLSGRKRVLDGDSAVPNVSELCHRKAKEKVQGSHGFKDLQTGRLRDVDTLSAEEMNQWTARTKDEEQKYANAFAKRMQHVRAGGQQ